jgi:hypothetical protein
MDRGVWRSRSAVRWRPHRLTVAVAVAGVLAVGVGPGGSASAARLACADHQPATTTGSPPASLLKILGVLRSRATQVAANQVPLRIPNSNLYVDYIRRARTAYGRTYYVYVAGAPRLLLCASPRLTVGGWLLSAGGVAGPYTANDVEDADAIGELGGQAPSIVSGLVPDGVATVAFSYKAGSVNGFSHKVLPAATITARVVNNVVVASVPRGGNTALNATIVWRSATGKVIKTIPGQP